MWGTSSHHIQKFEVFGNTPIIYGFVICDLWFVCLCLFLRFGRLSFSSHCRSGWFLSPLCNSVWKLSSRFGSFLSIQHCEECENKHSFSGFVVHACVAFAAHPQSNSLACQPIRSEFVLFSFLVNFFLKKRLDLGRTDLQRVERSIYSALQQNNGCIRFNIKINQFLYSFAKNKPLSFIQSPTANRRKKAVFGTWSHEKATAQEKNQKRERKTKGNVCFASSLHLEQALHATNASTADVFLMQ